MKTTIDREGRIALGQEVQSGLGVQPGDDVLLENRGTEWIIKAANDKAGLCYEGNVLVHRGVSPENVADILDTVRNERMDEISKGPG